MNNLKRIRKELGLTQSQLAKKAEISIRTIQEYEQERLDINGASGITLYKIAKALDCNMEDLLELARSNEVSKT